MCTAPFLLRGINALFATTPPLSGVHGAKLFATGMLDFVFSTIKFISLCVSDLPPIFMYQF